MIVQTVYKENIFFVFFKKHVCPQCGEQLEQSYTNEILPAKSKEARRYRRIGDAVYFGDVELRTACFYCNKCKKNVSYQEVRANEVKMKKCKK
jgi:uncharacterized protein with PIN domain